MLKKEEGLNKLSEEEVILDLKRQALPYFGTKNERLDRLKKHYGIVSAPQQSKESVLKEIDRIKQQRDDRRADMEKRKKDKIMKEIEYEAMGKLVDVDFEKMIDRERFRVSKLSEHVPSSQLKLCVCVRKRPIFKKEQNAGELDCISVANPEIKVFYSKFKVDGITKYIETNGFVFDNTFNENESTDELFESSLQPILHEIFEEGFVTLFAYGQTGSGKTHTMKGIQEISVSHIYKIREERFPTSCVFVSFYEIYGGRCFDLLANKNKVQILEDKNNNVVIQGLYEKEVYNEDDLLNTIEFAFDQRTTHSTTSNDTSSRSHAVCQILIKSAEGVLKGKLIVVDLAGSERAQDTQSNNRQRRLEGAEINKSLLALKECIRAMDGSSGHIPFRASKLTLSIRDSFLSKGFNNRVIMVACLCPGSLSADHSLNTLRYADRLKGKKLVQNYNLPAINPNLNDLNEIPQPQILDKKEFYPIKPILPREAKVPEKLVDLRQREESDFTLPSLNNMQTKKEQPVENKWASKPNQKQESLPKATRKDPSKDLPSQKNIPAQKVSPSPLIALQSYETDRHLYKEEKKIQRIKPEAKEILPKITTDANNKIDMRDKYKEDLNFMKQTLREDQNHFVDPDPEVKEPKLSDEYFNFHEKVSDIIDLHDELLALHLNIIKEDAQLLTEESEVIKKAQSETIEYEIDNYVTDIETIVKKKLHIYKLLSQKIKNFKRALKEEEEISSKVRGTFYY
jgi:kinesin family protein 2/24